MIRYNSTYELDWSDLIPQNWDTLRIKNVFEEVDYRTETGLEELLSVSAYTGVTPKRLSLENEGDHITNAKTLVGYKKVAKDDLVSNIMLAWNGSLAISSFDGITSPAYCVYRLIKDYNPHYFGYLFGTNLMKAEFRKKSYGIIESRLRLYTDKFFSIRIPIPPKETQNEIVEYIENKEIVISNLLSSNESLYGKMDKKRGLIKEYKEAMIAEAVLGKLNTAVHTKLEMENAK